MTRPPLGVRAGAKAAALACSLAFAAACGPQPSVAQDVYSWEPASAEVAVGQGVRVAVRVEGPSGLVALSSDAVGEARIDMAPDGMASMVAPLRPVAAEAGESLAWETDLVMAGRWALKVTADVPDAAEHVTGEVIITAKDE
jgi:Cu(I)/Ag(I) efflux system membrane fusion protein